MSIFSSKLQAYSVRRLKGYGESFHEWKIIPLYFIENVFGEKFWLLFKP